ncbi:MAG TPA: hypothetical protein VLE70_03040, partial [Anaerolineae bacterium]|nr:hypothetical protein [Anaerolineae bacterium]
PQTNTPPSSTATHSGVLRLLTLTTRQIFRSDVWRLDGRTCQSHSLWASKQTGRDEGGGHRGRP